MMNEWNDIVCVVDILFDKFGKIVCFKGVLIVFKIFFNVVYIIMMLIGIVVKLYVSIYKIVVIKNDDEIVIFSNCFLLYLLVIVFVYIFSNNIGISL